MRVSQYFCPTLKEAPRDAEVISHQLMVRAGLIRKVASGIYTILPIGKRVFQKVEAIIREELNRIGAQELFMPAVVPAELWQATGRWQKYGKELLRITDRHDNEFCFGPTHEEVVTDLIAKSIKSYKQLPLSVYQIQTKFRDEVRPRFGLMRGREFLMKDAYSFHEDMNSLDQTYAAFEQAYTAIFKRLGLSFRMVAADSGAIGGDCSAEFMVTSETGEDAIIECPHCGYAANLEAAECLSEALSSGVQSSDSLVEIEKISTPGAKSMDAVAGFLGKTPQDLVKSIAYDVDGSAVVVLVRGDKAVNEIKVKNYFQGAEVRLLTDEEVKERLHSVSGYIGPYGLPESIPLLADKSLESIVSWTVGANAVDFHFSNVVPTRDLPNLIWGDFRNAEVGDRCSFCQIGSYTIVRGIEVGHIFKLGDKYAKSLGANILNKEGKSVVMQMGCYGIGVGRTIAAAIEQNHDENGIRWPKAIAPFLFQIIVVNPKKEAQFERAEALYQFCLSKGIDVFYDDRFESPGRKFSDADLWGIPYQIIIGKGIEEDDTIEIKNRFDQTRERIKGSEVEAWILEKDES